jgi:hypothetical protein
VVGDPATSSSRDRPSKRMGDSDKNNEGAEQTMRSYERPTLTAAGSFKKITGLGGHGPRDVIARHQAL